MSSFLTTLKLFGEFIGTPTLDILDLGGKAETGTYIYKEPERIQKTDMPPRSKD